MQSADRPETKKSRAPLITVLVVLGIVISAGAGYVGALMATGFSSGGGTGVVNFESVEGDGNTVVTEGEQDVASVVAKVSPSVVSIVTTSRDSSSLYSRNYSYQAAGTGMIVSKNGYVMTNKHVIEKASEVSIVTSSGTTYDNVRVVGTDPLNDIAFLKISGANDLTPVQLGDSKTIRVGQTVIAIGNALGQYQNTVTTGIVSGLGRPVTASSSDSAADAENLTDLIQTDAAINQGNSGGPLLNSSGQVIGINTAVAFDAQSIGFAIPIGAAKGMIKQVVATGTIARALVGVQYVSVDPEIRAEHDLSVGAGDLVTAISDSDSPAAKAGIKKGDVITKVNDQKVEPGKSISTLVGEFEPGQTVQLTIQRGTSTLTKQVTLSSHRN